MTLTEEQILALHQKLRDMRHDVNGRLANILAWYDNEWGYVQQMVYLLEYFLQLYAERLYGFAFCSSVVRQNNAVFVVKNDYVAACRADIDTDAERTLVSKRFETSPPGFLRRNYVRLFLLHKSFLRFQSYIPE